MRRTFFFNIFFFLCVFSVLEILMLNYIYVYAYPLSLSVYVCIYFYECVYTDILHIYVCTETHIEVYVCI